MDDAELARRSILGFCETLAALGGDAAVRRENAIGARVADSDNPWLDAAAVPHGFAPPQADDAGLPHCLWAEADAIPGRDERGHIAMPCMGLALDGAGVRTRRAADLVTPSLDEVGAINDRAYGQVDALGAARPRAPATTAILTHGAARRGRLRVRRADAAHRRRRLDPVRRDRARPPRARASPPACMLDIMNNARATGATTATLQASPDGLPVYERLGFRTVATLRRSSASSAARRRRPQRPQHFLYFLPLPTPTRRRCGPAARRARRPPGRRRRPRGRGPRRPRRRTRWPAASASTRATVSGATTGWRGAPGAIARMRRSSSSA